MSDPKLTSPLKRTSSKVSAQESPSKKERHDEAGDDLDFDAMMLTSGGSPLLDFDDLKKEDISTKGLAEWNAEEKNANVCVSDVRVKLDKDFDSKYKKGATSQVFTLLVEDSTGAANLASFGESAKRLKNLLGDKRVCLPYVTTENLEVRPCKEEFVKFLPGDIANELHFVPRSTVFFPEAPHDVPVSLAETKGMLGRRTVALNVVVMEKFAEIVHQDGRTDWKSVVTDGKHMIAIVLPFAPHFGAGDEIKIGSASVRYTGDDIWIAIKEAGDTAIEDVEERKVPRKGLKRSELEWLKP